METNRGLLLCQLINDRKVDNEVGADIRKLLIEGVDINIQDLNRRSNTPLHLATQKSDKKCIQLLLKYKPDLQITNGNDETPFDVAQSTEVKELLSSASFDVVEKKFVHEIEFQNLSLERLKCLETDPAFKIFKITCCPKVQTVWEKLNQNDFICFINQSSHLFVIAIETQEDEIEDEIKNLLTPPVNIKRSIIVQITSNVSEKSLIYYKEENSKQLIEIKLHSAISKNDFVQKIQHEANCNFPLLAQALSSNILGAFSGSLLDVKLSTDKYRNEIVNCYAKSNAFCHRFFKLFDEKLTEEELNARVNYTLKFTENQSLLALLDLPFDFKDDVKLSDNQKRILNFVDSRNYNLIMIAIERNNTDAVKTLLRFPIDLDHLANDNRWASDLCWEKQNWECLAELIAADSPYPENFDASFPSFASSTSFERIKSSMEAATAFHESIQCRDIGMVKAFITSNPKRKHVYDRSNKSALTVALEYDDAEIYSLLLSEGFTPGVDDEYDEAFKNCNVKDDIRNGNRKYFKNAFDEPHLVRLLNKYKLSFNSSLNRETYSQVIQKMFLKLNEIPEMVPILQIVSCSEQLNIVFDFDCHSVQEMDPTVGSSTKGIVYPIGGFIYVGAENYREDFCKVIGTLAHELTHYAMKLTYENGCKPYSINDKTKQEIFESIVSETRELVQADPSTDSIVSRVFTCYKQEVWHQELIVRVPHLMATYKNVEETLEEARHKNYRLFDFFLSKVLSDVKAQTKVLLHKLDVKKINSLTGTIERIKKQEIKLKKCEIKLEDQIIGSNAPQLTLGMLGQSLDESSHVFINIEQIAFGAIRERISKLEMKDFAIVVDCTEMVQEHEETVCNIRQIFKTGKIFLVLAAEKASMIATKLSNFRMTQIKQVWSDLTGDSQEVLLHKHVNFQGIPRSLKDLTIRSPVALQELPLNELFNSENFKIGDPLAVPFHKFYLPRSFITRIPRNINKNNQLENDLDTGDNSRPQIEKRIFKSGPKNIEGMFDSEQFETFEKTLNEILVDSKSKTVVIISDSAGTGKTSTLHEIAKNMRENDTTRWTILTDLKKLINMFKKIQPGEDFNSFQGFVTQIILADKSSFEKQLWTQFYQEGRTNILFDGFDEISPHYKEEVFKALKLFTPKSGNQLWITTRSHLELELEKTLGQLSCSLQPLTIEDQIEFLENIWKSDTKSSALNSQENLSITAKDLVDKLSSISDSNSSFIGLPILISMVAEIYDNSEKRNSIQPEKLSFYSIFKQFVEKNINDLSMEKGEIAATERKEISLQSESIVEVHRIIAIAHLFGNEVADFVVDYDDEEWTVEKLTRLGLIRYDESKRSLSFIHETFAEYFLTDFIVRNLRSKKRSLDAVKFLVEVLTKKDFQVVRLFLDQASKDLNFVLDKKLCKTVGKQLDFMRKEASGVLMLISKEYCEEVFKFMLNSNEYVKEQSLLNNTRDEDGNNVLLINIEFSKKATIQILFDFITQNKLKIAKILYQSVNENRENIFHIATRNKNKEILPILFENIAKSLKTEEIKNMLRDKDKYKWSVLHHAGANCSEYAMNDLLKVLLKIFGNEEVKELFKVKTDCNNCLHLAAMRNNKIAIKSFLNVIHSKEILNFEETKKMIKRRGWNQNNIFHSACYNKNDDIFPTLYECTSKFLEKRQIKKMFLKKNKDESNVLQLAAAYSNENACHYLVKMLKELVNNEVVKEMMLEVNKDGNNSLHLAVLNNNKIALKCFFKHLNDNLNFREIRKLIQQKGFHEKNIFHAALKNENEEIFSTLYEYILKHFWEVEIRKMLMEKDKNDDDVLQCATRPCNENVFNDRVQIFRKLFSNEEMKEMLFEVNINAINCNDGHCYRTNNIKLKSFFMHLALNYDLNFRETMKFIQQKGFDESNVVLSNFLNRNEEIFLNLFEWTAKFFKRREIENMVEERNDDDHSAPHFVAKFHSEGYFVLENYAQMTGAFFNWLHRTASKTH